MDNSFISLIITMILKVISTLLLGLIFGFQTNTIVPDTATVEVPATTIESTDPGLTLILSCQYKGSLGRGDTFDCHVDEVTQGSLDEKNIVLEIAAGSYDGDRLATIGVDSGSVYRGEQKTFSVLAHFENTYHPSKAEQRQYANYVPYGFRNEHGIRELIDVQPVEAKR